ncbi:hypothetical protein ABPG74_012886 [Tetrahymena malaccensis]
MKYKIQIIFILIQLVLFIKCKLSNLFLNQEVHDIDPLSLADEDISQEYNHLNITRSRQYLVVENIDNPSSKVCWSFFLEDFIDLDFETENRFVRVLFQKLDTTSQLNVIGLESIEHNKFKRIFIKQDGQIGYAYSDEKLVQKSDEKVYLANTIAKEHTFKWSQGDTIQIFYFAEEKQILLYNQSKDNLFKFSESLIDKLGRKFKIFIGISSYNDQVILSNYL